MITFSRLQHSLWQLILIGLIGLNVFLFKSPVFGLILCLIYIELNSKKLADIFFSQMHQGLRKTLGFLLILVYIAVSYTIAYHFYKINSYIFWWLIISIPLIVELISWRKNTMHYYLQDARWPVISDLRKIILPTLVIAADILLVVAMFRQANTGVIRSPWELLNYKFWALFIFSNSCLILTIIIKKSAKNLWLIIMHFFVLAIIAVVVYPIGYGYDSFIHLATLKTIETTGSIQPRLFLYIGQYGLTFFFQGLTQLSLSTANKLLLPALFALLWPSSLFYGLKYAFNWPFKNSYLATLWSLFLCFSFFIMTTPQGLAFLLLAFYIFILPVVNKKDLSIYVLWLVTAITMVIHPLGGIPMLFFNTALSVARLKKYPQLKNIVYFIILFLASLSLPIFFFVYELLNKVPLHKIFQLNFWPLFNLPSFNWYQTYNFPLDFIHNIGQNRVWLYIITVIIGLILILKNNKQIFFKRLLAFILVLIINYLIAKIFFAFSLNIGYQKDDYLNRIILMIGLACLPIFLTTIYFATRDILARHGVWSKIWLMIVTVIIVCIGTYFSYPVYDRHQNDKSFNVTATDIKTVKIIDGLAGQEPYIVLANQMVGAAAIYEYNFAHYYNGDFYYSMPLGADNIYQNYLAMIENNASREEAIRAMDKAEVNKLYFVVNNYWHSAKQAITQAGQSANETFQVDNGVNTIFVYKR